MRALFSHRDHEPPIVFGHRGYSSRAPENTMAAFRLCRDHGVPGVELDVHRCASGEIVVIHDDTLKRVAGADVSIAEASYAEIVKHDIGSWFDPQFSSERVPTLEAVLDLLGSNHYLDIEIKPHSGVRGAAHPHSIEWDVVRMIRERGLVSHTLISSFDPRIVRRVGELAPEIPRAAIYAQSPEVPWFLRKGLGARIGGATVIKPQHNQVTVDTARSSKRRGVPIVTWTVDDPNEAVRLAGVAVAGIVSNRPAEIMQAIR